MGEVNNGEMILGFGGATNSSGFGITRATTGCFTGIGFGWGFQGTTGGAAIGVIQYRLTTSSF
jgi:hypothetical protein